MLELYATSRFTAWFESLSDIDAETVATAIEVLQARAEDSAHEKEQEQEQEHGSPYLLWYQNSSLDAPGLEQRLQTHLRSAEMMRSLLRRMESPSVRALYRALPKHEAHRVDDALGMLRRWAARVRLDRGHTRKAVGELQAVFGEALLDTKLERDACALRELQLPAAKPRWRIVFGLDRSRGAGLLVLGEALDREHYGESVRWALACWERFRAGARDDVAPAPA